MKILRKLAEILHIIISSVKKILMCKTTAENLGKIDCLLTEIHNLTFPDWPLALSSRPH